MKGLTIPGTGLPAGSCPASHRAGRVQGFFVSRQSGFPGITTALAGILLFATQVHAQRQYAPPPQAAPSIAQTYFSDKDGDRINDALMARLKEVRAAFPAATSEEEKSRIDERLDEQVEVELIFRRPVTQQQIDDFIAAGGKISYMYKAVSYGWNGSIPLDKVDRLVSLMGEEIALVDEPQQAVLHLDIATRAGRARPVWAGGFAGAASGFTGDTSITIAVVDSGIDPNHIDLAGRQVYWNDFTSDGLVSPSDLLQHGSHVAGVAFGTGAAGGSEGGELRYTEAGNLTYVASGSFYPSPVSLPEEPLTFTSMARWTGGGSTSLYQLWHQAGFYSGWMAISSPRNGFSPLTLTNTFTPSAGNVYSAALLANNGVIQNYVVSNRVSNYPGAGDGFNTFSGVAPGCNWAAAKVFANSGTCKITWIGAAVDELVANRIAYDIKVMNLSLGVTGDPGIDTSLRQKINTAVNNGIVVVISTGNEGTKSTAAKRQIDDPGRAAMALTVAAVNDLNRLTDYSSHGFSNPQSATGCEEDFKPDIAAPGGSSYCTHIMSVDSGSGDTASFPDQQPNDYRNTSGTSLASPFAAGAAALVIDAMQKAGTVWDFSSSQHSRYVKMLLCATASETNAYRESSQYNPTLQRAAQGPSGYPAGKDMYEGYGMINPDAAVEAAILEFSRSSHSAESLGPGVFDRRVWARKTKLAAGETFSPRLAVPAEADFDMYLYSEEPGTYGTPIILASSTNAGCGEAEAIDYRPENDANAVIVIKRVSGGGQFDIFDLARQRTVNISAGEGGDAAPCGAITVFCGENILVTASAEAGYQIGNWHVDGNIVQIGGEVFELTDIRENHEVTVTFSKIPLIAVSGHITNGCGTPIDGVLVESEAGSADISDANGFYTVWTDQNGSDCISLSKQYYTFSQTSSAYSSAEGGTETLDFRGLNPFDYDCDGSIGWGDMAVLAENWLAVISDEAGRQIQVNLYEYARFSNVWLTEYGS